jgi:small subunit ribosomal protein S7
LPRKGLIQHRDVLADPVYDTPLVQKFINCMMWDGKKAVAEQIFYHSLEKMKGKSGEEDPLRLFKKAVENVKPLMEVKTRRVGGANYQIPIEVSQDRRVSLSIRWLIGSARRRGEKGMTEKLAAEFLDAYNNRGAAVKKKEDVHRMAEANRAFAHYRW